MFIPSTVYVQPVYLGVKEYYDRFDMKGLADSILRDARYAMLPTHVVIVHEHGGWYLGYTILDGEVVGILTANDRAIYDHKITALKKSWYTVPHYCLPTIRR